MVLWLLFIKFSSTREQAVIVTVESSLSQAQCETKLNQVSLTFF